MKENAFKEVAVDHANKIAIAKVLEEEYGRIVNKMIKSFDDDPGVRNQVYWKHRAALLQQIINALHYQGK